MLLNLPSLRRSSGPTLSNHSLRLLSVLSWGRNVEGQCGVETAIIVARPTPITELHGADVTSLSAGKLASSAILRRGVNKDGEAWTWGCGKAGKLGQGSSDHVHEPFRVESLVGRANLKSMSLGEHHSLFLDARGSVWACGENKEGQCGLGTPIEVIASQHRKAFYGAMQPPAGGRFPAPMQAGRGGAAGSSAPSSSNGATAAAVAAAMGGKGGGWKPRDQQLSKYLKNLMQTELPHQQQYRAGMQAFTQQQAGGGSGRMGLGLGLSQPSSGPGGQVASALGWGGFDMEGHLTASGLQPGQLPTPMRIGRDQHPISGLVLDGGPASLSGTMEMAGALGLEDQQVVACDASRYFSVLATSTGQVWTFGACYNGSLGSDSSWSTSAQPVSGPLAKAIEDGGGAVQVAAGGTFCLALTTQGRVVVWGKLPGQETPDPSAVETLDLPAGAGNGGRVLAGVVEGLPPIRHIAAGQSHALLSDGERVWAIGKMLDSSGKESGSASWTNPQELLHLPADGVQSIACGAHSSAVVSGDGQLYMWGRLLEFHHAESLIKRHAASHAYNLLVPEDVRWKWAGFGADKPTLVEGLSGVTGVALGGWHAMVLVE